MGKKGARVFLGLGSNLGDREGWIRQAIEELQRRGIEMVRSSSLYRTEPVGFTAQPDFLNLAIEAQSDLDPLPLLEACLEVECVLGRERRLKNGPRNIDIDLLYHGNAVTRSERLTLPHPRISQRAFVLRPLCEIAPGFRAPDSGKTIRQMLQACPDVSRVEIWKRL